MCYDISFATKYELITQYVPDLIVDPQIGFNYDMNLHAQAQAFRKYPVIINDEGVKKLVAMEWGDVSPDVCSARRHQRTYSDFRGLPGKLGHRR